jgi:hypothetical protein
MEQPTPTENLPTSTENLPTSTENLPTLIVTNNNRFYKITPLVKYEITRLNSTNKNDVYINDNNKTDNMIYDLDLNNILVNYTIPALTAGGGKTMNASKKLRKIKHIKQSRRQKRRTARKHAY